MDLVYACVDFAKKSQQAVFQRALGMADIFDMAVSDSVDVIQGVYSSSRTPKYSLIETDHIGSNLKDGISHLYQAISLDNVYYYVAALLSLGGFFALYFTWKMFKTWKLTMHLDTGNGTVFYSSYTLPNDESFQAVDNQLNTASGLLDKRIKEFHTSYQLPPRPVRKPSFNARDNMQIGAAETQNETSLLRRNIKIRSTGRKLSANRYVSVATDPVTKYRQVSPLVAPACSRSPISLSLTKKMNRVLTKGPKRNRSLRRKQSSPRKKCKGGNNVRRSPTVIKTARSFSPMLSTKISVSPTRHKLRQMRQSSRLPSITRWGGVDCNDDCPVPSATVKICASPNRKMVVRRVVKQDNRRDEKRGRDTKCYSPLNTKPVRRNTSLKQKESFRRSKTPNADRPRKKNNAPELKDKSGIRIKHQVSGNRKKKCKTCKKYKKPSPQRTAPKHFTHTQNNLSSLFYHVPKTTIQCIQKSNVNFLTHQIQTPPSLSNVNGQMVRTKMEDTNMNKSGIRSDKLYGNEDRITHVQGNHTVYTMADDWSLSQGSNRGMDDCQVMECMPLDNVRDYNDTPNTNLGQTLTRNGEKMVETRITRDDFEGMHKTINQCHTKKGNHKFQGMSNAGQCDYPYHNGSVLCGVDRRTRQQNHDVVHDPIKTVFDHQGCPSKRHEHCRDKSSNVEGGRGTLQRDWKASQNGNDEFPTNRNDIDRTSRLLYKRKQLNKDYPNKCQRYAIKQSPLVVEETVHQDPSAALENSRQYLNSDLLRSKMDMSSNIFHNQTKKSTKNLLSLGKQDNIDSALKALSDLKCLKEKTLVSQQDITDSDTYVVVNRKFLKGFVEHDRLDNDLNIKRKDKIKSHKWRHRHMPYKTDCPKQSRGTSPPRNKHVLYSTCRHRYPKTGSTDCQTVEWPTEQRQHDRLGYEHATRLDSDDQSNSISDQNDISVDFLRNKNNCSPSRGGKIESRDVRGGHSPSQGGHNHLKTKTGKPLMKPDTAIQQTDGTASKHGTTAKACLKGQGGRNKPRHTTNTKRSCDDEHEHPIIPVPPKVLADDRRVHHTNNVDIDRPHLDTVLQYNKMDFFSPNSSSEIIRAHGSTVSEGSSSPTTASRLRRRRRYLKEKRLRYPNQYKKQTSKTVDYPCFKSRISTDRSYGYVSLGVQTSGVCLVNMAVQTSPALDPRLCKHHRTLSPGTCREKVCEDGGSRMTKIDSRNLERVNSHREPNSVNNDPDVITNHGIFHELNKLTGVQTSYGRNGPGVLHASGRLSPSTSCMHPTSVDVSTESKSFGFVNGDVNESPVTTSPFEYPTQQSPVKHDTRQQLMAQQSPVKHAGDQQSTSPISSFQSPDDTTHDMMASSPNSNKSWVARPRWEDANVDEINRRVEKALRLRQELQRCRNENSSVVRQHSTNQERGTCSSATRELSNSSTLTKEGNNTFPSTTSGYDTKPQKANNVNKDKVSDFKRYAVRNIEKTHMHGRDVASSLLTKNTNAHTINATEIDEDHMSDMTDTLCSTDLFRLNQKESIVERGTMEEHFRLFGCKPEHKTLPNETDDSTLEPERSDSFPQESRYTQLSSGVPRPPCGDSMSNLTLNTNVDLHGHAARDSELTKNSPPIRISKIENVIQSQYSKLVEELVQALPQVPLSSFVEWFIETSHPEHFANLESSSSPGAKTDTKVTSNNSTSISTEIDQSRYTSKRNLTYTGQVYDHVENNVLGQLPRSSAVNANLFGGQIQSESPDGDKVCDGLGDGGNESQKAMPCSIRRILLKRDEREETDFDSRTMSQMSGKRRVINITRQSSDASATVREDN